MNSENLSKSAQNIQNILAQIGNHFKVIELSVSARTAQEAADALGCKVAQIVKSLIFRTKTTQRPILVLACGLNRVNEKMIQAHVGEEIIKADPDFTREVTGFAIGGIPPLGHKQPIETLIDKDLLQFEELWAAAGTPHAVFKLGPADLELLTKGAIISIC
ncbi:MAG: Cys-tRNA(Pro)/Cys-tRNA(Cys) deacylase YbaK [bacterium ADurb.BinA186]|nr:MAG: Cys-tRNA(Pro)/Cys-tRNA(Cys) deacylase YbaK [bacterium ADurb.BinA186]